MQFIIMEYFLFQTFSICFFLKCSTGCKEEIILKKELVWIFFFFASVMNLLIIYNDLNLTGNIQMENAMIG